MKKQSDKFRTWDILWDNIPGFFKRLKKKKIPVLDKRDDVDVETKFSV